MLAWKSLEINIVIVNFIFSHLGKLIKYDENERIVMQVIVFK